MCVLVFLCEFWYNVFVMKLSRRDVLKISGVGFVAMSMLPRVAFASRNSVLSLRTGVQPNGKTRLVIETSGRPSYDISYPQNQLVISLANTSVGGVSPKLSGDTLIKNLDDLKHIL